MKRFNAPNTDMTKFRGESNSLCESDGRWIGVLESWLFAITCGLMEQGIMLEGLILMR